MSKINRNLAIQPNQISSNSGNKFVVGKFLKRINSLKNYPSRINVDKALIQNNRTSQFLKHFSMIENIGSDIRTPTTDDKLKYAPRLGAQFIQNVLRAAEPEIRSNDLKVFKDEIEKKIKSPNDEIKSLEESINNLAVKSKKINKKNKELATQNEQIKQILLKQKQNPEATNNTVEDIKFLKDQLKTNNLKLNTNNEKLKANSQLITEQQAHKHNLENGSHTNQQNETRHQKNLISDYNKKGKKETLKQALDEAIDLKSKASTNKVEYSKELEFAAQSYANFLASKESKSGPKISHFVDIRKDISSSSIMDDKNKQPKGIYSKPADRANAVGFNSTSTKHKKRSAAENIQVIKINPKATTQEVNDAVLDALRINFVDANVEDRGHQRNFLSESEYLGIGVAQKGENLYVVIQFGAEKKYEST